MDVWTVVISAIDDVRLRCDRHETIRERAGRIDNFVAQSRDQPDIGPAVNQQRHVAIDGRVIADIQVVDAVDPGILFDQRIEVTLSNFDLDKVR